eukprot:3557274-Lingulodinium_polyedra.AAC.1
MTCFFGVVRISEPLALHWRDVVSHRGSVIFLLGKTKRGEREKVAVQHSFFGAWWQAFAARSTGLRDDK